MLSWLTGVENQYVDTGSLLSNHALSHDEENWLFSAVCTKAGAAGRRKEALSGMARSRTLSRRCSSSDGQHEFIEFALEALWRQADEPCFQADTDHTMHGPKQSAGTNSPVFR